MKQIEFKAYVDGIEVAHTGPYSFSKVLNQVEDQDTLQIGHELMESVRNYYTDIAEEMNQEDYQR